MKRTAQPWYVRLPIWAVICLLIAWPSILFSWHEYDRTAIVCALGTIIGAHTLVSGAPAFVRFLRRPHMRATLRWMYGAAIGAAVVFPVAFAIQIVTGAIASELFDPMHHLDEFEDPVPFTPHAFIRTFATALFAAALNFGVMCVCGVVAYSILSTIGRRKSNVNICIHCGYDIRASRQFGRCPECGMPLPAL